MAEQGIIQAEQRVREMNRMTQQYAERGNRYMQNMNIPQPRFEPMHDHSGQDTGNTDPLPVQELSPEIHTVHNQNIRPQNDSPSNVNRIHQGHHHNDPPGRGLTAFGIESDKLLLIALIYLLIKENADIKLILALGYLLF